MSVLAELYRLPLGLLTDFYQLTMAQGYRRAGMGEVEGVFHLFFRKSPFGGGFAVARGLSRVLDFVEGFRFGDEDLLSWKDCRSRGVLHWLNVGSRR